MGFAFGPCAECCQSYICSGAVILRVFTPDVYPESSGCHVYFRDLATDAVFSGALSSTTQIGPPFNGYSILRSLNQIGVGSNGGLNNYEMYFDDCLGNVLPEGMSSSGVTISGCSLVNIDISYPSEYLVSGTIKGCPSNLGLPGATVQSFWYPGGFPSQIEYQEKGTTDSDGNYLVRLSGILKNPANNIVAGVRVTDVPSSMYKSGNSDSKTVNTYSAFISGILIDDITADIGVGYQCVCGGPMPTVRCYVDTCGTLSGFGQCGQFDFTNQCGSLSCNENYSPLGDLGAIVGCHDIYDQLLISSPLNIRVEPLGTSGCSWKFIKSCFYCPSDYPDQGCDFTSFIAGNDNLSLGSLSSTTTKTINEVWGPLGIPPTITLDDWTVVQTIEGCTLSNGNLPPQLVSSATYGPCGSVVTVNVEGSPRIDTWVSVYNSGTSIMVASGQTGSEGTFSWLLPSGGAPWLAIVDEVDCYSSYSGYIEVGTNTITLDTKEDCTKYVSPCSLCSGRAFSKTLSGTDNYGTPTMDWSSESGWVSSDGNYQVNCQSGWALTVNASGDILSFYEVDGTLEVDCNPLVLEVSSDYSIIITE